MKKNWGNLGFPNSIKIGMVGDTLTNLTHVVNVVVMSSGPANLA